VNAYQEIVVVSPNEKWSRALCHVLVEKMPVGKLQEVIPLLQEYNEEPAPLPAPVIVRGRVQRMTTFVTAKPISFPEEE